MKTERIRYHTSRSVQGRTGKTSDVPYDHVDRPGPAMRLSMDLVTAQHAVGLRMQPHQASMQALCNEVAMHAEVKHCRRKGRSFIPPSGLVVPSFTKVEEHFVCASPTCCLVKTKLPPMRVARLVWDRLQAHGRV